MPRGRRFAPPSDNDGIWVSIGNVRLRDRPVLPMCACCVLSVCLMNYSIDSRMRLECSLPLWGPPLECIVTVIGTVFLYFKKYRKMVGFGRVSRVSRVRIRVSVRIRVRFSFIGANQYRIHPSIQHQSVQPFHHNRHGPRSGDVVPLSVG